jgi:glycosyltransferase involved in cell wall biosynthesis
MRIPPKLMTRSAPLRVLYICHDGDLYGSQQSLLLLLEALPKDIIQPFVSVARPGPLLERLEAIPGVTILKHKRLQWIKHDHRTVSQQIGDLVSLNWGMATKIPKLKEMMRQHQIELVHTNSVVSLEGALAARQLKLPHLWHIRELFMMASPKLHPILSRQVTQNMVVSLSNKVLCISKAVQQQFEPHLSKQPTQFPVIYNALSPHLARSPQHQSQTPKLPQKQTRYRLGYVGRLSEGKRLHDLLEAMAIVEERHANWLDLLVCGNFVDDAYEAKIKALMEIRQLRGKVHFLGYQANLEPLYDNIDALVVPSLNEPFGRVIIEAAQAGVPTIAADSGGIPEIVDHGVTGILFPPENPEALADCLLETLENPDVLNTIARNAKEMISERFSIDAQVETILEVYAQVLV